MIRHIILILLFILNLNANQIITQINNQLYTLPNENKLIKKEIFNLIDNSKEEISIAIYNFDYKDILEKLLKASKRGVNITIILDKKKNSENKKISKIMKDNGIHIIIPKEKMHLKAAIFDKEKALIGSSNWTKESFTENYEIILITNDKKVIFKLENFIKSL